MCFICLFIQILVILTIELSMLSLKWLNQLWMFYVFLGYIPRRWELWFPRPAQCIARFIFALLGSPTTPSRKSAPPLQVNHHNLHHLWLVVEYHIILCFPYLSFLYLKFLSQSIICFQKTNGI